MSASNDSEQQPSSTFASTHATHTSSSSPIEPSKPLSLLSSSSSSLASSFSSPRRLRVQPSFPSSSHSSAEMELEPDEPRYPADGMADGEYSSAGSVSSSSSGVHNPSSSSAALPSFAAAGRPRPRSILKRATGRKRSLRWDESNLAVNESEKVPRMKVDEPKTPYHAAHQPSVMLAGVAAEEGEAGSNQPPHRSAFDQQRVDAVSLHSPHSTHSRHST